MILHVTFSDESNPWVFYGDRHQVAAHWRRWMKHHPHTAQPAVICGQWYVKPDFFHPGGYIVQQRDTWEKLEYKHLGHALAALERLGGETV